MDLVEFLTARLDEDERVARELSNLLVNLQWISDRAMRLQEAIESRLPRSEQSEVMAVLPAEPPGVEWIEAAIMRGTALDPARVLAEVAAKRGILAAYADACNSEYRLLPYHGGVATALGAALDFLLQPYADHPDFDETWRL